MSLLAVKVDNPSLSSWVNNNLVLQRVQSLSHNVWNNHVADFFYIKDILQNLSALVCKPGSVHVQHVVRD